MEACKVFSGSCPVEYFDIAGDGLEVPEKYFLIGELYFKGYRLIHICTDILASSRLRQYSNDVPQWQACSHKRESLTAIEVVCRMGHKFEKGVILQNKLL